MYGIHVRLPRFQLNNPHVISLQEPGVMTGSRRTSADDYADNCHRPDEQHVKFSSKQGHGTLEGIALKYLDPRPSHPKSMESSSRPEEQEMALRSKISDRVRRWSRSFDEGLWSRGNDIVVTVFKVEKLSWILKHFTFYRIHATYFITTGTLGTLVIYMLPLSSSRQLGLVDALYTSFSVLCGVGFQTISSQDLTYLQKMAIWLLMNLGAPVLISLTPLHIRRLYFYLCIQQNTEENVNRMEPSTSRASLSVNLKPCKIGPDEDISKARPQHPEANLTSSQKITSGEIHAIQAKSMTDKNGQIMEGADEKGSFRMFVDSREALRTLEYRALMSIARVVLCYFVGVQVIGFVLGVVYFLLSPGDAKIVTGKDMDPTFYAFFTSTAAFTNSGYFLTNDSMIAFQKSSFLLVIYSVLPLLGNALYPPFLRLLVWIHHRAAGEKKKPVYEYLLRHPRRCFISLFPRSQTIWLIVAFVALTSIQLIFICSLEWDHALGGMNFMQKLVAAFYQAVDTRNAGGSVVDLYQLAPAILFLFVVMMYSLIVIGASSAKHETMYISAYPMFLSLQTSNNADEYDDSELMASDSKGQVKTVHRWGNVIVAQSMKLLARDTSHLVVAILFLCLSESINIKRDPLNFSIFNIVFEVISAYGSIGLSTGYHCELRLDMSHPCEEVPYSFSGTWTSTGKLILVVVMLCGRHRGLPDDIDSAIRLPSRTLPATLSP